MKDKAQEFILWLKAQQQQQQCSLQNSEGDSKGHGSVCTLVIYITQMIRSVQLELCFKYGDYSLNGVCWKTFPNLSSKISYSQLFSHLGSQFGFSCYIQKEKEVTNGGVHACAETQGMWKIQVLPFPPVFCEPKTILKNKVFNFFFLLWRRPSSEIIVLGFNALLFSLNPYLFEPWKIFFFWSHSLVIFRLFNFFSTSSK